MNLEFGQVITQIIGFLIVLIILKRFAWKPLLSILEERRAKIKSEFDKLGEDKKSLKELTAEYEDKLKDIEGLARQKILEAAKEGQEMANQIKENARKEGLEIMNRSKEEIQREVEKAKVQLKNDMVNLSLLAAQKIIQLKLDQEKDRKLIRDFIEELEKIE
ncbi:MAG: F0F1 ATP synthase subunit B [candidate division Zixibacteria bacterium]|nr:F0F1 ATP synthase subunit B [candidate division Zixibacteria bacterium]